jgi:hypothetical protein
MEYQRANILLPHMLAFFHGRVCKKFAQYREWDKEIKEEIGRHVLEVYGLVEGDGKASDAGWALTRVLFDNVRHAGLPIQELNLGAAAMPLPGPKSLEANATKQLYGSKWTAEQKRYAKRFALSLKESYPRVRCYNGDDGGNVGRLPWRVRKEGNR